MSGIGIVCRNIYVIWFRCKMYSATELTVCNNSLSVRISLSNGKLEKHLTLFRARDTVNIIMNEHTALHRVCVITELFL